jgi:hypothetical protein
MVNFVYDENHTIRGDLTKHSRHNTNFVVRTNEKRESIEFHNRISYK